MMGGAWFYTIPIHGTSRGCAALVSILTSMRATQFRLTEIQMEIVIHSPKDVIETILVFKRFTIPLLHTILMLW